MRKKDMDPIAIRETKEHVSVPPPRRSRLLTFADEITKQAEGLIFETKKKNVMTVRFTKRVRTLRQSESKVSDSRRGQCFWV